jgi:hypothetical protein
MISENFLSRNQRLGIVETPKRQTKLKKGEMREISLHWGMFKSLQAHFSILLAHFNLFFSGHLRFRKSMISWGVVQTNSNPFSISCLASSLSLVALDV